MLERSGTGEDGPDTGELADGAIIKQGFCLEVHRMVQGLKRLDQQDVVGSCCLEHGAAFRFRLTDRFFAQNCPYRSRP